MTVLLPQTPRPAPPETDYLLKPAHVWDGESDQVHNDWAVLVHNDKIVRVGPANGFTYPPSAKVIDLPGLTLMPGLIEAHSHILLHPYSETPWNDQVARESLSLRVARATNHLRNTLRPVSRRFAISARKARATLMSVSNKRLSRASFPDRA
jgi:imidazolonepropionase-like amidohydrolase